MHIHHQKLGSNEFHWKWLLCTILCALLREAVGGQIRFDSERLEMLWVMKLSITRIKFWVCVLLWFNKWHQTMKLAPAGAVICRRLHFASVQMYGEISSTFLGNSGLVHLVRGVRKVSTSLVVCWMGSDPANQLWSKGRWTLKWGYA